MSYELVTNNSKIYHKCASCFNTVYVQSLLKQTFYPETTPYFHSSGEFLLVIVHYLLVRS